MVYYLKISVLVPDCFGTIFQFFFPSQTWIHPPTYEVTSKILVRWPGQCYGFTLSLIFKYCGGIYFLQADNALSVKRQKSYNLCYYRSLQNCYMYVMLKRRLNLFTAENNSESVDVLTQSNTATPGTVTCLPVAAVECLKLKR